MMFTRAPLKPVLGLCATAMLAACQDDGPAAGAIEVPSGREVTLIEVITNIPGNSGSAARFRFLAPGLSPSEIETAQTDMQALCDGYALPRTEGMVPTPTDIIISLSAEAVAFGQPSPDVTQFFETYHAEDGACVWAPF